jgi:Flp pilus assembly protein TadD
LPEPVWGPSGAVMICLIRGFGCVEGLAPIVFAAVTAAVLAGCQTTQPTEMTASRGAAAADGERSAPRLAERYRADPNDADAALHYAGALHATGRRVQALAVLEQASVQHPKNRGVLTAYGLALADIGHYKRALEVFDRAHADGAPDWRILSVQGAALDQIGRHEDAQRYYATALRLEPDELSVLSNLGLSYALAKDLVRAEATLRRAASQSRTDARVRESLALVMGLQRSGAPAGGVAGRPQTEIKVAQLRQALALQNGWREPPEWEKPQLRAEGS